MAWSEAARQAAAAARRTKRETLGDFHSGGTPRFDKFYTNPEYRKKLASQVREVRSLIKRRAGKLDYHEKTKIDEVMRASARAQGMKSHWQNPKNVYTPQGKRR